MIPNGLDLNYWAGVDLQHPTFNDLKQFIKENPCKMEESWNSMKEMCAEMILMKEFLKPGQRNLNNSSSRHVQVPSKKRENSMFVTTKGNSLGGGTSNALKALGADLRYLEGTERDHYWWEYVVIFYRKKT